MAGQLIEYDTFVSSRLQMMPTGKMCIWDLRWGWRTYGIFYFVLSFCTVMDNFVVYTDEFLLCCGCDKVLQQVGWGKLTFVQRRKCEERELERYASLLCEMIVGRITDFLRFVFMRGQRIWLVLTLCGIASLLFQVVEDMMLVSEIVRKSNCWASELQWSVYNISRNDVVGTI